MGLGVGPHEADIAQTVLVAQPASAGEPGRGDVYPQCASRGRSPGRFPRGLSRAAADVEDAVGGRTSIAARRCTWYRRSSAS